MRSKLMIALAVLALGACSTSIDVTNHGNGTCEQETQSKLFGVSYSTDRNLINCDAGER